MLRTKSPALARIFQPSRTMSRLIHFGPFEVTKQVFLETPQSFALVNLKPLLPGHVLVCPLQPHKRLTDLSASELADLMATVQRVQRMLARLYFSTSSSQTAPPETGSFNIAIQDGAEAGQTVGHVHVHVIPRIRGSTEKDPGPTDELYVRMSEEDGNVGGALWDAANEKLGKRPNPGGAFPRIEDSDREARDLDDMMKEVETYKTVLKAMGD